MFVLFSRNHQKSRVDDIEAINVGEIRQFSEKYGLLVTNRASMVNYFNVNHILYLNYIDAQYMLLISVHLGLI